MNQFDGKVFLGHLHSADASIATLIPLFDVDGVAITLGPTQRLAITELFFCSVPGGDVTVFADRDGDGNIDAGETLVRGEVTAKGGLALHFGSTPLFSPKGTSVKIKAPAGVIDVTITGRIVHN